MYINHYKNNLTIALPIILSLAGQSVVQIADSVMVGRTGAAPLAAVSFAGAVITNIMVIGLGLTIGLTPVAVCTGQEASSAECQGISKTHSP